MPTSIAATLDKAVERIEHADWLDAPADALASVLRRVLPVSRMKHVASGAPVGHPVHPVLVALPIGSWSAATYLDLVAPRNGRKAARKLVGLGNLAAIPTALTGTNDWLDTSGAERRVGFAHTTLNYATVTLYLNSWLARRKGHHVKGALLSLAGAGVMAGAGWLGGHLAYALGVGVDTTAFQHAPQEWTAVAAESDILADRPRRGDAAGVPVLLVRDGMQIIALADRCTHRGGPLHEGEVANGCVTCPWHGSQFRLSDGEVQHGPASRPQPVFEVRVHEGMVEVRRASEERSLRKRPVGV